MNRLPTLLFAAVPVCFALTTLASESAQKNEKKDRAFAVLRLAFSLKGDRLAVGGGSDGFNVPFVVPKRGVKGNPNPPWGGAGFVKVFSVNDWKQIVCFREPFTNRVQSLGFLDNDRLAAFNRSYYPVARRVGSDPSVSSVSYFTLDGGGRLLKRAIMRPSYGGAPLPICHLATGQICFFTEASETVLGEIKDIVGGNPMDKGRLTATATRRLTLKGSSILSLYLFSPDGKKLLVCPRPLKFQGEVRNLLIKLHETDKGDTLATLELKGTSVKHAEFSRDGSRLALAGDDKKVYVLTGDLKKTLKVITTGYVSRLSAFSPDNQSIATATAADTVNVFELNSGKVLLTLDGLKDGANCVAFSPDGTLLAIGCGNTSGAGEVVTPGSVRVYNVKTGMLAAKLE